MQYGVCHLSIVPIRSVADDTGEMISQLLYGEHYKILEQRKTWSKIRVAFDKCEGWILNCQITLMNEEAYTHLDTNPENVRYAADLVSFVSTEDETLLPIVLGSTIPLSAVLKHTFEGTSVAHLPEKTNLLQTALLYINAPFLWGGRTPFGLDCSGFTQMTYKINGVCLKRTALAQSAQGEPLSFIEESEPGDLAFFDNKDGIIDHVGLVMENNYIIHCHGKIRIDRIDHTGIFNTELNQYTHQLRVIKKII